MSHCLHEMCFKKKLKKLTFYCSRSRNALLNGDTKHYDWDSGYTCHQLGSGAILIQLGKPTIYTALELLLTGTLCRATVHNIEPETVVVGLRRPQLQLLRGILREHLGLGDGGGPNQREL